MASLHQVAASLLLLASTADAAVARDVPFFGGTNPVAPYAPLTGFCPNSKLVRSADGLGGPEQAWFNKKKAKADPALRSWLSKFGNFQAGSMPNIASSVAGGYLRASLLGAGIHQQLDGNEGQGPMAGLLQAISYEATLSGSVAYQIGLIQNNWPSIRSLSAGLWEPNYATGMMPGAAQGQSGLATAQIAADVSAKTAASFPTTLLDIYGRIIGWSNMYTPDGGVSTLISDARNKPAFANGDVPLPLFTAIGTKQTAASCQPTTNGTQYEFTPFEFGSWDNGLHAFMDVKYLGTRMFNGNPAVPACTTGFDNLGFGAAATANTLSYGCQVLPSTPAPSPFQAPFDAIIRAIQGGVNRVYYAAIPNPFQGLRSASIVANDPEIDLVDGGNSGQVIPLWPLLQRKFLNVVFVWDNYYDLNGEYTTGGQIHNTYTAAQAAGLTNVPTIPDPNEFAARGLNTRPYAFGCNNNNVQTWIYVPYQPYVTPTQSTFNLTTTPEQTRGIVTNGNRLATYNGQQDWPQCVACMIMKKQGGTLPDFCGACYTKYCYN